MADPRQPIGVCRVPVSALYDHNLSRTDLAVLVAIGEHADAMGRCYPSQERLGAFAGVGRRRANKAVQRLVKAGYLLLTGRDMRRCCYQLLPGPFGDEGATPPDPAMRAGARKCATGGAQGSEHGDEPGGYPQSANSQADNPQGKCATGGAQGHECTEPDPDVRHRGRTILRQRGRTNQPNKKTTTPPYPPTGGNGPSPPAPEAGEDGKAERRRRRRKRGSVGPAGGRAGSPRGRGAKAVPATGPPP